MTSIIIRYLPGRKEDEDLLALVKRVGERLNVQVIEIKHDAISDPPLEIKVGPYRLTPPFSDTELEVAIRAAQDRARQLSSLPHLDYEQKKNRGSQLFFIDRAYLWISNHYLAIINIFLIVYLGLAFLAPVLEKSGAVFPAQVIYRLYSNLCHQLAYRSWFLFGEQAYYPRELAHIPGLITYEAATGLFAEDLGAAREFTGNSLTGYKVALCQRDVAMYGAFLIFSLLFGIRKYRIRQLPFFWFLLVGAFPIALDGFSQIPSLASGLPSWLPVRESTPLLRSITGTLFGFTLAWFFIPMLHESVLETKQLILTKIEKIRQQNRTTGTNDNSSG